jgi:ribosomal protein S18 acetylase RimI-like enzyme
VIGFALAHTDRAPEPWLESLHVVERLRGHGIGTLLMRSIAAHFRARGYNSLRLGVLVGNQDAARFYERLGLTLVGVEPVSWAEGVWHQVYQWSDLGQLTL